jgi:signal transduction histidine kinase/ActR/RegA family two-component response regulator
VTLPSFASTDARLWGRVAAVSLAAIALSWVLMQTQAFKRLDLHLGDFQARMLSPKLAMNDLLIVDIDEQSMTQLRPKLGVWPYERHIYAQVTKFLQAAQAKAIIFDIVFSDERAGDDEFARTLEATPNTALASASIFRSPEPNAEDLRDLARLAWPVEGAPAAFQLGEVTLPRRALKRGANAHVGVIHLAVDDDGRLRRVPLLHRVHGYHLPSLPLASVFAGEAKPPVGFDPGTRDLAIGDKLFRVNAAGEVSLKFPSDLNSIDVLPFHQLVAAMDGHERAEPIMQRVSGKKVFIGSSTAVLGDHVLTLYGEVPGLLALAATTGMLERALVLRPAQRGIDALLVLTAVAFPLLAFRRSMGTTPWLGVLTMSAGVGLVVAVSCLLYWQDQASGLLHPILAALLVFASLTFLRLFMLYRERQRLTTEKMAAEQAYQLKSQFISQMTHELRTPLAAIMGYNKLLAETGSAEKSRDQYSRVIAKNSDHLMTLINNMLDQSKLEAGQIKINIAPARIRDVVEDVVTTLSTLARDKQLDLTAAYHPSLPTVLDLDGFRLRQILINLTGNAIKFTQRGSVNVDTEWHDGQLTLAVRDTGPGVPPSAAQRIFEPFQQGTDSTERVHGGTGLGLSISRNMCQLMHGNLTVQSALGKGSTFLVTIPARECPQEALPAEPKPSAPAADEKLSGQVLLADDNQDIRELVSRYLARMGLEVLTAQNGAEAVSIATQHPVQVILMDMEMPVMRGNVAVTRLRAMGYTRPILALTAHPEGPEVEQALRDGCDGYVAKPVNREQLFATLRELLQRESVRGSNTSTTLSA